MPRTSGQPVVPDPSDPLSDHWLLPGEEGGMRHFAHCCHADSFISTYHSTSPRVW
uniref:Uncharacterized protein n=1 Tax=Anguilla anguilla TaxID=7936 RepID=A0A0E9WHT2_ANGAN